MRKPISGVRKIKELLGIIRIVALIVVLSKYVWFVLIELDGVWHNAYIFEHFVQDPRVAQICNEPLAMTRRDSV